MHSPLDLARTLASLALLATLVGCADGDVFSEPRIPDASDDASDDASNGELGEIAESLVALHNNTRANVVPAASPALPPVTWNSDLAAVAQAYSNECYWGHNGDRTSDFGTGTYVGENIAVSGGGGAEVPFQGLYNLWANEINVYDYENNTCPANEMCGHYTQIAWRGSTEIGCGWTLCPSMGNSGYTNAWFLVCNYAPGGNINGQRPY